MHFCRSCFVRSSHVSKDMLYKRTLAGSFHNDKTTVVGAGTLSHEIGWFSLLQRGQYGRGWDCSPKGGIKTWMKNFSYVAFAMKSAVVKRREEEA